MVYTQVSLLVLSVFGSNAQDRDVVSTSVGGVPEVLPDHMITLTEPNAHDIVEALSDAIPTVRHVRPMHLHREVRRMYNWHNVAQRTERVYEKVIQYGNETLFTRLKRYVSCWIEMIIVNESE